MNTVIGIDPSSGESFTVFRFTVPCIPVAQPRARAVAFSGKARMYEASKSHAIHAFKATVKLAARQAHDGPPLTGPLAMDLVFVFPRPAQMQWKKREMPRARHTKAPDADNAWKAVSDALNGLLFADDKQICVTSIEKWIAAGDEQPHVEVTVRTL